MILNSGGLRNGSYSIFGNGSNMYTNGTNQGSQGYTFSLK